jgi:type I restriction enzyme S subunit
LFVKEFHNSDPKFIYYFLKTLDLNKYNSGSAVPSLNRNYIHPIEVVVPETIEQQQKISLFLTSLDDKIELNRQMNSTLEQIAQALFKRWFIDFEFPNENGNPYKSSGGRMVDSELEEIPEGWEVKQIGDICETFGAGNSKNQRTFLLGGRKRFLGNTY